MNTPFSDSAEVFRAVVTVISTADGKAPESHTVYYGPYGSEQHAEDAVRRAEVRTVLFNRQRRRAHENSGVPLETRHTEGHVERGEVAWKRAT